jgi:ParB-like chromosome segregation protein Spo0J
MEPGDDLLEPVPVVDVPITALSVVNSPRTSGADPEHVEVLAAAWDELPPIIVHRSTMCVIDGMHRLEAAKLAGQETIPVRFFEGSKDDAFVLAVRMNSAHGMPLSIADRKRAAERILLTHPHWSARRLVATVGIAPGTLLEIRRKLLGDPAPGEVRIGRDGKARPVDAAAGRRIATELIIENPQLSLRKVARAAGISPETVRRLRNQLRDAGELSETRTGEPNGNAWPKRSDGPMDLVTDGGNGELLAAAFERLKSDPALRFSGTGRDLLRLLHVQLVRAEEWQDLIESLPPDSRAVVVQLARRCAEFWAEFSAHVGRKVVNLSD